VVLQAEKASHFVHHAGYGCSMVVNSAFESLERDGEQVMLDGVNVDRTLMTKPDDMLQKLVEVQHRSQFRSHLQLAAIEKQFHKVTAQNVQLVLLCRYFFKHDMWCW